MDNAEHQHFAWLARSFGRTDYLPLTPDDLQALSGAGEYVEKYPGTHLFREGTPATAAFVLQRGQVELYRTRQEGRRVVGRVGEGGVIGDIAMFQNQPYISSAKAVGAVVAFRFDRQRLLPVLLEHPTIAMRWLVAGLSNSKRCSAEYFDSCTERSGSRSLKCSSTKRTAMAKYIYLKAAWQLCSEPAGSPSTKPYRLSVVSSSSKPAIESSGFSMKQDFRS